MKGSEFVEQFQKKGLAAWEVAARKLAHEGSIVEWPCTLKVQSDKRRAGALLPVEKSGAANAGRGSGNDLRVDDTRS